MVLWQQRVIIGLRMRSVISIQSAHGCGPAMAEPGRQLNRKKLLSVRAAAIKRVSKITQINYKQVLACEAARAIFVQLRPPCMCPTHLVPNVSVCFTGYSVLVIESIAKGVEFLNAMLFILLMPSGNCVHNPMTKNCIPVCVCVHAPYVRDTCDNGTQ